MWKKWIEEHAYEDWWDQLGNIQKIHGQYALIIRPEN